MKPTPRRLSLFLATVAALLISASSTATTPRRPEEPEKLIRRLLAVQAAAWNHGDIPAFMELYDRSEKLRFASGGTITYGWQPTLDRYLKRYPDKATMGTLGFTIHEVDVLAPDAAVVFGKWELTRAADKPWGLFTLVLKRSPAGWRIVSDHTSSAE